MRLQLHLQTCWVIFLLILNNHRSLSVKFANNGYDILVAIHRSVPENMTIITQLTKMLESASEYLYTTTRKYVYIKNVTVLVPDTWTRNPAWRQVNDVTFSEADIRVDSPHPAQNDIPYTFNPGQCGDEGRYIHLTPDFLLDNENARDRRFGNVGRLLVHEFAHLRFGVFDEYGIPGSSQYPIYYIDKDDTGTKVLPTACSREISGNFVDQENNRFCTEEDLKRKPPSVHCSFKVRMSDNKAIASVMFAQFLEEVTEFCERRTEDEKLKHNEDAPNLHNKMCNGEATWDIIQNHQDVRDSKPNVIDNRQPTFQVVQRQTNVNGKRVCGRRLVLVLDVSGSMVSFNRYFKLRQIADRTIRDILPVGTEVGIVVFSSDARIWRHMMFLTSSSDRDTLAEGLPKYADFGGFTAIGLGLKEAIKMLKVNGKSTENARLFLITDGKENKEPLVEEVMPDIVHENIVVHTLAYSDSADDVLGNISVQTGGLYFYFDESNTSVGLDGAAESLLLDISLCKEEDPIEIDRHAVLLTSTTTTSEREIPIDSTIGNNTLFVFTLPKGAATEAVLTDPSGKEHGTGSSYYSKDNTLNIVRYHIPLAQVGTWKYRLTGRSKPTGGESVVGVFKSHPRHDTPTFQVETWKRLYTDNGSTSNKLAYFLYVYVHKGYAPVLNAQISIASVQRPPKDDGNLPDNTANDGVYTTLAAFRPNGRFSIEVTVKSNNETVVLEFGNSQSGGALTLYPRPYQPEVLVPVERFSRTASGGAIDIIGYNSTLDQLDPGRITDLDITIHGNVSLSVTLTWTAPGDDLYTGIVTRYELRIAKSFSDLRNNFTSETLVKTNDILNGSLNPLPAGAKQSVVIRLPSNWSHDIYVVGLKAYDEASRSSGLSNLRSFTFKSLGLRSKPIPSADEGSLSRATLWIGIVAGVTTLSVIIIIVIIASILCFPKKQNTSNNLA